LPLDVKATAFQRRVWAELRGIPYGSTRSTARSPRPSGCPGAARAVARACASIGSPWSSPVIGSSGETATSAAIGGEGRKQCSSTSRASGGGRLSEGSIHRDGPAISTPRAASASAHSLRQVFRRRTRLLLRGGDHRR
jgi:alkylated DNA nucleotide flippase Atl1